LREKKIGSVQEVYNQEKNFKEVSFT